MCYRSFALSHLSDICFQIFFYYIKTKQTSMRQTATLTSLSGSLGKSVKLILTFLFLNFLTQSISAQSVKIDGLANSAPQGANEWCQSGLTHIQDLYGNGVAEDQYATGSKDWQYAADWRWSFSQTKGKNDL